MGGKEKKPSGWVSTAEKDKRFAKVLDNPLYRRVPKKEKRVNIDKRFESMFHDDKFKLKYHMDKRGKPMNTTTTENLKRLYHLESEDKSDHGETDDVEEKKNPAESGSEDGEASSDEGDKLDHHFEQPDTSKKAQTKVSETERKKLRSAIDYTRGEGVFVSEESDDDSSTDEEDLTEDVMHEWGELDRDAPTTEDATNRLALCNMDWDRLTANDLMVLFSSFLSTGGRLQSVTIYPSEFGKQRLAEEELHGPKELIERDSAEDSNEDEEEELNDDDEEGSRFSMEKLRKYQLNRLKYYYAVLVFDSVSSADKVYTECDGMEYESSATKVDLRFIPDDMTFDEEPKDVSDSIPTKYRPRLFTTTALQQAKVNLTWDETDPRRKELTEKIFNPKENIDDEDIKAYLASSESESENEDDADNAADTVEGSKKVDPVSKYKALLQSIEDSERKKKDKDVQMEISWGVGLKDKTEKLVQKKLEEEEAKKRTPWEEMLAKRREKRKNRKSVKKLDSDLKSDQDNSSQEQSDDRPFSDDEVDVDMNDTFFKDAFHDDEAIPKLKSKKKHDKTHMKNKPSVGEEGEEKSKELELLLMDDEPDTKKHFSLKKIMAAETEEASTGKKKKKKLKKKQLKAATQPETVDDFAVDLKDDRFSALYSSHEFNIDPSDPNYKKTKSMEAIISEKLKRRTEKPQKDDNVKKFKGMEVESVSQESSSTNTSKKLDKADVAFLVQSLKGRSKSWLPKKS